jgi:hypothetical protein
MICFDVSDSPIVSIRASVAANVLTKTQNEIEKTLCRFVVAPKSTLLPALSENSMTCIPLITGDAGAGANLAPPLKKLGCSALVVYTYSTYRFFFV